MFGREKIAALVAEFIGTFTLATVVMAMISQTSFSFFAAVMAGSVLGLMTLVVGTNAGVHLNPAVTIGLWTQRKIETSKSILYIVAQLLGGFLALVFAEYVFKSPLKSIAGDSFDGSILVAETVGAFIFTFGVASAIALGYEGLRKAVTIGASLAVGIAVAGLGVGNGMINPAVALGSQSWSLAYVVGPIIGGIVGFSVYGLLFAPRTRTQRIKAAVAAKTKTAKKTIKKTTKKVAKKKS